jgi:predicted nucleotidyltransferase
MTSAELEKLLSVRLRDTESHGVVSAYLFGSAAEGRSHRESDVDVGVLLDPSIHGTARSRFEQRIVLSSRLANALGGREVDLVILNGAPPHLARRIVTRGRRFFCAAPEADHAFVRDVQLRAADLEPFLRRMQRIKLERLSHP